MPATPVTRGRDLALPTAEDDILVLVKADRSPVEDLPSARKYMAQEGYDPETMNSLEKLSLVVLSISTRVETVPHKHLLRAIAYMIANRDEAEAEFTQKVTDALQPGLTDFHKEMESASKFLSATQTGFADALLKTKEKADALEQQVTELTAAIESCKELQELSGIPPLPLQNTPARSWAQVAANVESRPVKAATMEELKLQQRCELKERRMLITYDPTDPTAPGAWSVATARELRLKLNSAIEAACKARPEVLTPTSIHLITRLDNNGLLLEFDHKSGPITFSAESEQLLPLICTTAKVKQQTFPLIFRFVPCTFDPNNEIDISQITDGANIRRHDIAEIKWIKKLEDRHEGQEVANIKVMMNSEEAANQLLGTRLFLHDSLVVLSKDKREPIRCNKCQEYGHIRAKCRNSERCGTCASGAHDTARCTSKSEPKCVSCGPTSSHASTSRECGAFLEKCQNLDNKYPENRMFFYPTSERWTWVTDETHLRKAALTTGSNEIPIGQFIRPNRRANRRSRSPHPRDPSSSNPFTSQNPNPNPTPPPTRPPGAAPGAPRRQATLLQRGFTNADEPHPPPLRP